MSLASERADIITLPRLSSGKILLAAQTASDGRRSISLPILKDRDLRDGWKTPVQNELGELGIDCGRTVRPLGVLRFTAGNALVVLIDGCRITVSSQVIAAHETEIREMIREGEIRCDVTLAALDMLRASRHVQTPPPYRLLAQAAKRFGAPPV